MGLALSLEVAACFGLLGALTPDLMHGFPHTMLKTTSTDKFWRNAEELLHITPTDKLDNPIFAQLQVDIDKKLIAGVRAREINHTNLVESARLAVGMTTFLSTKAFNKFSTPRPLLKIYEHQLLWIDFPTFNFQSYLIKTSYLISDHPGVWLYVQYYKVQGHMQHTYLTHGQHMHHCALWHSTATLEPYNNVHKTKYR